MSLLTINLAISKHFYSLTIASVKQRKWKRVYISCVWPAMASVLVQTLVWAIYLYVLLISVVSFDFLKCVISTMLVQILIIALSLIMISFIIAPFLLIKLTLWTTHRSIISKHVIQVVCGLFSCQNLNLSASRMCLIV